MVKIFGFCGISNSGKTTLIEKITKHLINKNRILCIKHDPKNKAIFDTEGKDSARFFSLGADVFIASNQKNAFFSHQNKDLIFLFNSIKNDYDYIFVEGYKDFICPRICVARSNAGGISMDELKLAQAIALDSILLRNFCNQNKYKVFDIEDVQSIILWIKDQAIELERILDYGYN